MSNRSRQTARGRLAVVCAVAVALLAAAAAAPAERSEKLARVEVGALFPLTGSNAGAGRDALHGAQLAVAVLNGSYPAIRLARLTVAKIALDVADTHGSADVAATEVDRLVGEGKVAALLGAYQSSVTLTASERAEALRVPFVNGSSSSTSLTQRGLRWFFRTGPSDLSFTKTYFTWLQAIRKQHRVRRVAVIHTADAFGNDGAKVIKSVASKHRVKIVGDIGFQSGAADLTAEVRGLRAAAADAVFALMYTPDAILFTRTMAKLRYTPPAVLAYGAGYADPQFARSLGKLASYSVTRAAWALDIARTNRVARAVANAFRARFGQPMTENSAREFTATMTLGQAIQRARSTHAAQIRSALASFRTSRTIMPWNGIRFNANGQNVLAGGVIEQLVKGAYRVLWPRRAATAKVVWPMPRLDKRT